MCFYLFLKTEEEATHQMPIMSDSNVRTKAPFGLGFCAPSADTFCYFKGGLDSDI